MMVGHVLKTPDAVRITTTEDGHVFLAARTGSRLDAGQFWWTGRLFFCLPLLLVFSLYSRHDEDGSGFRLAGRSGTHR